MQGFTSLRVEVVTDPSDPKCILERDQYISIRGDLPELEEGQKGLCHVWFVITRAELKELRRGFYAELRDGYHRLTVTGDESIFFNMEMPTRFNRGEAAIPYYRACIPRQVWRIIHRLAARAWEGQKRAYLSGVSRYDVPRVSLELSAEMRKRWETIYGQGKGKVEVVVEPSSYEDTQAAFAERMTESGKGSLHESVERLKAIASNLTDAKYQVAKVVLHRDLDGYYFGFLNPRGRLDGLRGGVVNHGRDGKQDWSIHT